MQILSIGYKGLNMNKLTIEEFIIVQNWFNKNYISYKEFLRLTGLIF
jgi:hypothetical protein